MSAVMFEKLQQGSTQSSPVQTAAVVELKDCQNVEQLSRSSWCVPRANKIKAYNVRELIVALICQQTSRLWPFAALIYFGIRLCVSVMWDLHRHSCA